MAISDSQKKFFLTAAAIIVADQIIKFSVLSARQQLPLHLIPGTLGVSYAQNTGIAFGFLQGNNVLLGMISAAIAALIIIMFYRNKIKDGIETLAVALILGGTLSNLIDRAFRGAVIDYLTLKWIPTFNLADAALTAGAALIITSYITRKIRK